MATVGVRAPRRYPTRDPVPMSSAESAATTGRPRMSSGYRRRRGARDSIPAMVALTELTSKGQSTAGPEAGHEGRRTILRLDVNWPWARDLELAFQSLRALPISL